MERLDYRELAAAGFKQLLNAMPIFIIVACQMSFLQELFFACGNSIILSIKFQFVFWQRLFYEGI
jgi:hypothetical protein